MPSETAPRTAHDLLDAILAPTGEVAPGVLRPAVREHTREAYDALYRTPQVLPAPVLHAFAVVTAEWQGSGALAAWHRAQGADPSLAAADAPADPALAALRDHVDLLSVSPALVTQEDQQRLAEAGHDATVVVLISLLFAFEGHLQRLVVGLAILEGLEAPDVLAPSSALRSRGRRAEHGGTTRTGRTRPAAYTPEQLQWEPWVAVPAENELYVAQRDSVDLRYQIETLQLVRQITREEGISALIAIHDLNHAARYCDQIVVLHGGRLVAGARLAELDEHGGIRADAVAAVPR